MHSTLRCVVISEFEVTEDRGTHIANLQLTKESSSSTDEGDKNTITLRNIDDESMERGLLSSDSSDSEHPKEREDDDQGYEGKERQERLRENGPANQ